MVTEDGPPPREAGFRRRQRNAPAPANPGNRNRGSMVILDTARQTFGAVSQQLALEGGPRPWREGIGWERYWYADVGRFPSSSADGKHLDRTGWALSLAVSTQC